jgi:TonB family protein
MTLAEALTQRLPSWERTNQAEAALPSGMPPEFVDLARHCLRRDPQLRWSVADIAARLQPNASAQPKQIIPSAQSSFDPRRYTLPALIAILALAAIIVGPRFFGHHSRQTPPEASVVAKRPAAQPGAQPAAPLKPDPQLSPNLTKKPAVTPPGPPVVKPAPPIAPPPVAKPTSQPVKQAVSPPVKDSNEKQTASDSAAAHSGAPAAIPSGAGVVRGKVIQQVLPNASQTARGTIRGTVRVSVKVHVDESGGVTQATFDSRGPSQYFADRALQAAQLWKFASPKIDGHSVASDWVIRFEIDPTVIRVFPAETAP